MSTGVITGTCIGAGIGVGVHGSRYRCGYMQGLIQV